MLFVKLICLHKKIDNNHQILENFDYYLKFTKLITDIRSKNSAGHFLHLLIHLFPIKYMNNYLEAIILKLDFELIMRLQIYLQDLMKL